MAVELRQWRLEDADAQARAIEESLAHLLPWMAWATEWPKPREEQLETLREWERRRLAGEDEFLGVWLDGELVGSCGAEEGVERVWRLSRAAWSAGRASPPPGRS